jgi:beta-lactamase superfamily II metal-dependent hydrolase
MPLTVHFLNVGQGDCTIIEFPSGNIGIVDLDNLKIFDADTEAELLQEYRESLDYTLGRFLGRSPLDLEREFVRKQEEQLTDPIAYFNVHLGPARPVFRLLITHPDMDHMTGLYRLTEQEPGKPILNFWHTGMYNFDHDKTTDEEWEESRYDKRDWETYKRLRASSSDPKALQNYQGAQGDYWTQDGVEIWAPTPELERLAVERNEPNILSMVLKIVYKGKSIVLGGDATTDETWPTIYPKLDMKGIDVLKASHHGRKSGYYWPAVKEMSPWLTITSVGEKEHDATESYRQYSDYTVSLRKTGDIKITVTDDGILHYPTLIKDHWKPKKVPVST